jgi:diguanylate cyclase (GGDEF)-like protein
MWRVTDFRIGSRLAAAFSLLLGGTIALIWFTQLQLDRTGKVSRDIIARQLRDVTLAHEARSAAEDSAALLESLLLLDERSQRVPVYLGLDADIAQRDHALRELMATAQRPDTIELLTEVLRTRDAFANRLADITLAVEERDGSARQLMVSDTRPALNAFLRALNHLAAHESSQALQTVSNLQQLQAASQRRILLFGIGAVALALVLAVGIARSITVPLSRIVNVAGEIAAGRFDGQLPPGRRDEVGDLARALAQMRDGIAAREAHINDLAFVDPQTRLPNRTAFGAQLDQALTEILNAGRELSVALLNLDRFRQVNNYLGHAVGDIVLTEVAQRLQRLASAHQCRLARLGGDEFAILMPDCDLGRSTQIARWAIQAMEEPLIVAGQAIDVSGSIGIALAPEHGTDRKALLSHADLALHCAKKTRSNFQVFEPRMQASASRGLSLLSELRAAVEEDQLELVFQPKLDLKSGHYSSVEALLRWRHPHLGLVSPGEFIPFAEQTGFVVRLTRWVIEHACAQIAEWRRSSSMLRLSVNVSARDIEVEGFAAFVAAQLHRHGLPAESLCLEITESAVMENVAQARKALEELNNMGLYLSIDDYGTGYASLAYLRALPVHEMKIDQSFVRGLTSNAGDEVIIRSTIALAHNLGLKVVAEGVESDAALAQLVLLGCDEAQGYYLSRPLSAEDFARWRAARAPFERAIASHSRLAEEPPVKVGSIVG